MSSEISNLTNETLAMAAPVLTAYPHHSSSGAFEAAPERWADQELRRIEALLVGSGGAAAAISRNQAAVGVVCVRERSWESQHYPFAMGDLPVVASAGGDPTEIYPPMIAWALDEAASRGLRHLLCRAPVGDHPLIHALEAANFRHMGTMLQFVWRRGTLRIERPSSWTIRVARPSEERKLRKLAVLVFDQMPTRYAADPTLPRLGTRRLYAAWMAESLKGRFADVTLVAADEDDRVTAFACMQHDRELERTLGKGATVGTLAGPGPNLRRPGAFHAIVEAGLAWSWEQGAEFCVGWTQAGNHAAQRTYLETGATLGGAYHAFHHFRG